MLHKSPRANCPPTGEARVISLGIHSARTSNINSYPSPNRPTNYKTRRIPKVHGNKLNEDREKKSVNTVEGSKDVICLIGAGAAGRTSLANCQRLLG